MTSYVLFVDDEEPNLVVFEAVCGEVFPVLTAPSAAQGLALMDMYDVAVVLSDQRMPDMSGIEMLEKIHAKYPETIRMLITAYSDLEAAEDAINRGHVRRYLRKPWDPEQLKAEIRDAFELHDLQRKLRETEHRLLETERAHVLGAVATDVGAEVRRPMAQVETGLSTSEEELSEMMSLLSSEAPDLATVRQKLLRMSTSLSDAQSGVTRVYSLIESLKASPPKKENDEPIDLGETVRESMRVAARSGSHGRVFVEVQGKAPPVRGSESQLGQIVYNLLTNALRAAAETTQERGGIVTIMMHAEESASVLEVTDNGATVASEDIDVLFRSFGSVQRGGRSGIGLAISRRIAQQLGGELTAAALDSGGMRFVLRLPAIR